MERIVCQSSIAMGCHSSKFVSGTEEGFILLDKGMLEQRVVNREKVGVCKLIFVC